MKNKKRNENILNSCLFLIILYISVLANYSINNYSTQESIIYSFVDIIIISCVMMFIPFLIRMYNKKPLEYEKGTKLCKTNSIILFIISVILKAMELYSFVGGIGAIMYYYINKWLFVNIDNTNNCENEEKDTANKDIIYSKKEENTFVELDEKSQLIENSDLSQTAKIKLLQNKDFLSVNELKDMITKIKNPQTNEKVFCTHCGKEVQETWEFCKFCGNKIK